METELGKVSCFENGKNGPDRRSVTIWEYDPNWRDGPQTKKKSLGCKLESATACRVIASFAS
jgi:hypothetical protein